MSTTQKLRGDSQLTNLKAAWQKLSSDARSYWSDLFVSQTAQAEIRKQLGAKLKVNLRFDSQLNKFRAWAEAQAQRELMAEKIEERKAELLAGGMSLNDAQEVLLTEAAAYSTTARDFKLGLKVSREISNTKRDSLEARRIALLEQKAAQSDATDKVLSDADLTPEQREQRIKEIYGRA